MFVCLHWEGVRPSEGGGLHLEAGGLPLHGVWLQMEGSAQRVGICLCGWRGSAFGWSASEGFDLPMGLGVRQNPPSHIHGILQDMVNKWAVHILLECILVNDTFTLTKSDTECYTGRTQLV